MPYVVAVFAVGLLGNYLIRRAKSKNAKLMILVPSMIAMMVLLIMWMS